MDTKVIRRGEIYYANLNPVVGSEQGHTRPVIVVQNNTGNRYSPTIVIVPITCNIKKTALPTHVGIPHFSGLEVDSMALVEQIRTLDRSRFTEYIGRIGDETQKEIDNALAVCVGIKKASDTLTLCLCRRCEENFRDSGCVVVKKGYQEFKKTCDYCGTKLGLVFGIFKNSELTAPPRNNKQKYSFDNKT